jgi:hypothetical protein
MSTLVLDQATLPALADSLEAPSEVLPQVSFASFAL